MRIVNGKSVGLLLSLVVAASHALSAGAESLPVVTARLMAPDTPIALDPAVKVRPADPQPFRLVAAFQVKPGWSVRVPVAPQALKTDDKQELSVDSIGSGPLRLGLVDTPHYEIVSAAFDEMKSSLGPLGSAPATSAPRPREASPSEVRTFTENFSIVLTLSRALPPEVQGQADSSGRDSSEAPPSGRVSGPLGSNAAPTLTATPSHSDFGSDMGLLKAVWAACRGEQCIPGEASLLFQLPD